MALAVINVPDKQMKVKIHWTPPIKNSGQWSLHECSGNVIVRQVNALMRQIQ